MRQDSATALNYAPPVLTRRPQDQLRRFEQCPSRRLAGFQAEAKPRSFP